MTQITSALSIFAPDQKNLAAFELGLGLTGMPYQIPNVRIENPEAVAHTRIGWLRAVNNIQHAFAAQSFIAEVANSVGKDHRAYLLDLLGPDRLIDPRKIEPWNHGESPERYPINTGRLRRVIERVTQEAGWGRKMSSGQGLGLAAHYSFVSYMAAVVEVAVGPKGDLVVPRVDIAVDCGPQINPDRIRSQLEGACVMGLSQAVVSEITFKSGQVLTLRNSWAELIEREVVSVVFQGQKAGGKIQRLFKVDGIDATSIDTCEIYSQENGFPVNRTIITEPDETMGRTRSAKNFALVLEDKEAPLNTADEAVKLMKIIDGVYASAKTGRPVELS